MKRFEGRSILISAGADGLGLGIAERLAAEGGKVVALDKSAEAIAAAKQRPQAMKIRFEEVDLLDAAAVEAAIGGLSAEGLRFDTLINNAGGSPQAKAATASPRFFDSILKLNLHAPMYMAQAAFPHMQAAGGGSIVNVASVSGIRPSPDTSTAQPE